MNQQVRILLCEDEENLGNILTELLENHDYKVDHCPDGVAGWEKFQANEYDICVLDVMMPLRDGISLAKDIRMVDKTVPIIFLTAMGMRENILEGFHAGADDYMTKPFSMEELLLRLEAILRRAGKISQSGKPILEEYNIGRYIFNTTSQTLAYEGQTQRLTTKETELLSLLCQFANQTLERAYALEMIWGITEQSADDDSQQSFSQRSMDVYVTKLRRMLRLDPEVEIKNVHGKGYKLLVPPLRR